MSGWTAAQIASALYSQLFLCSLSLKRVATELERARELRSESSHPSDGDARNVRVRAATIVGDAQSDEKETFTLPTPANKKPKGRQQQLPFDDSCVKPKRGRSNAGSSKPVNFEGRKPTGGGECEEADTIAGFGNPVVREDLLAENDE